MSECKHSGAVDAGWSYTAWCPDCGACNFGPRSSLKTSWHYPKTAERRKDEAEEKSRRAASAELNDALDTLIQSELISQKTARGIRLAMKTADALSEEWARKRLCIAGLLCVPFIGALVFSGAPIYFRALGGMLAVIVGLLCVFGL